MFPLWRPEVQQRGKKERESIIELLPEMLTSALSKNDDFIVTFETNPDDWETGSSCITGEINYPVYAGNVEKQG